MSHTIDINMIMVKAIMYTYYCDVVNVIDHEFNRFYFVYRAELTVKVTRSH